MAQFRFAPALFIATSLVAVTSCDVANQGNELQESKAVMARSEPPPAAATGRSLVAPFSSTTAVESNRSSVEEPVSCEKTEDGFSSFFNIFVVDDRMRAAHIAETIEIRRSDDSAKLIGRETAKQVEPFKITLGSDYRWTLVTPGSSEPVLGEPLDISMKVEANVARVDFIRAEYGQDEDLVRTFGPRMGYVFEFRNRCWQLTSELR